jgi:hypothetical protein
LPSTPLQRPPWRVWSANGTGSPLPSQAKALALPLKAFPGWFLSIRCERCGETRMVNEAQTPWREVRLVYVLRRLRHAGCGGEAPASNCTAASRAATAASWCGGSCCAAGDPQKKSPGSETGSRGFRSGGCPSPALTRETVPPDLIAPRARPTPVTIGNAGCLCPVHRVTAQRRVRRIALRADPASPE